MSPYSPIFLCLAILLFNCRASGQDILDAQVPMHSFYSDLLPIPLPKDIERNKVHVIHYSLIPKDSLDKWKERYNKKSFIIRSKDAFSLGQAIFDRSGHLDTLINWGYNSPNPANIKQQEQYFVRNEKGLILAHYTLGFNDWNGYLLDSTRFYYSSESFPDSSHHTVTPGMGAIIQGQRATLTRYFKADKQDETDFNPPPNTKKCTALYQNAEGNLLQKKTFRHIITGDWLLVHQSDYQYDEQGRVTSIEFWSEGDRSKTKMTWKHNEAGQITHRETVDHGSWHKQQIKYEYDPDGLMVQAKVKDRNGSFLLIQLEIEYWEDRP